MLGRWTIFAVTCLLVSSAGAKSVDFVPDDDLLEIEIDGEHVIMPKDGNSPQPKGDFDAALIQPRHYGFPSWTWNKITKVQMPLTPGVPASFSYDFEKKCSGKKWFISAPMGCMINLNCTLSMPKSPKCNAGMCKLSTGGYKNRFCGSKSISCSSAYPISLMGWQFWGGYGGFFECTVMANEPTTTAATTTAVTTTGTTSGGTTTGTTSGGTTTGTTTGGTTTGTTTGGTTTGTTTGGTTSGGTTVALPTCRCGRKNPIVRIVGGVETTEHEYPWQVGIVQSGKKKPFCGGSFISDQYIMTAAHCVTGTSASSIQVVAGEHNWAIASETTATTKLNVESITIHPDYSQSTLDNDIAIIKLSSPVTFPSDNTIAPVCLPPAGDTYDAVDATVTGWGTLSQGGRQPYKLREVTVPTMSNSACQQLLGASLITDNMLCAGPTSGGKDACQGDSGGPLTTPGGADYEVQIGVVSWGFGCAQKNSPGVYTRVNNYLDWIDSIIAGSVICPPPP